VSGPVIANIVHMSLHRLDGDNLGRWSRAASGNRAMWHDSRL